MSSKDYYKLLSIQKTASEADVKTAFKKLARKYHPDLNPDDKVAEEKFKEISEAYEVLSDKKKRQQYDQHGSFNFGSGGPQNPFQQNYWQQSNFNEVDLEDIFGDIFGSGGPKRGRRPQGGGGSSFNFGGFGGGGQTRSRNGTDVNWSLPISFLESVNGCEKQVLLPDGKKIKVKIPAGVVEGSKIRVTGKGNAGVAGGKAGNLIIETKVGSHSYFKLDGVDIHLDLPVSLEEALSGAKVTVPTIKGPVQLKIPKGSQSGQKMRLKGKGATHLKTKAVGNQYVRLQVKYPDSLSGADQAKIIAILDGYDAAVRDFSE